MRWRRCLSGHRDNDGNSWNWRSQGRISRWWNDAQRSLQGRSLDTNRWARLDVVLGHVSNKLIGNLSQKCSSQGSIVSRAVIAGGHELNNIARLFEHLPGTRVFITIQESHLLNEIRSCVSFLCSSDVWC